MILNTNCLPFPISPGLRAIILQHIADSFAACVLSFHHRDNLSPVDHDVPPPVEIAVDTDGSLIYISDFRPNGVSPHHIFVAETYFDFSRNRAYDPVSGVSPNRERERFQAWEHAFVDRYRLGSYEVDVLPLLELEEIVAAA